MDCPINTKINDSHFTKLLAEYKTTPQEKKIQFQHYEN